MSSPEKVSDYEPDDGSSKSEVNTVDSSSRMTMASKSVPVASLPRWAEPNSAGLACFLKC